jgi:dimethylamine/trimethylamine dehydrogenase
LPGLGEWRRLVDYRLAAVERLPGVQLRTGTRFGVDDVLASGAAIVVVATGASWSREGVSPATHEPLPGSGLPHVLVPEDVLAGAEVGETVAVVDCEGYFMGVGLAEALALRGASVSVVTPFAPAAPFLDRTLEGGPVRARLHALGVDVRTETQPTAIQPGALEATRYGAQTTIPAETVVLMTSRTSDDALLRALRGRTVDASSGDVGAVYGIGDCIAPRLLSDCVFDGHRLAREIDGGDPSRPLPFARERRLARTTPDEAYVPAPAARAS